MLALLAGVMMTAGDPVATALETAKEQLARHDEVAARKTLERAIKLASDKPERLGEVYLYLGLAWAESANEARAVESFGIALKLDGTLELPVGQPPKIQTWWKRAGGRVEPPAPAPAARPVPAPEPVAVEQAPAPPQVTEPAPAPTTAPKSRLWLLPAGLAAVSAVACGVLWQQSESRYAQLAGAPAGFTGAESVGSTGKALQAGGWAALTVAAALALASVVMLLLG